MGQGNLVAQLIDVYTFVVIVAVIISWLRLPPYHPVARYTRLLTEPALAPIRKLLPPVGGLDFSPMILIIVLRVIRGMF